MIGAHLLIAALLMQVADTSTVISQPGSLLGGLFAIVFPLVAGYIVKWVTNGIKSVASPIANAPVWAKQVIVVLVSFALSWVWNFFHIVGTPPPGLEAIDSTAIQTILTAALAMLFHNSKKLAELLGATDPAAPVGQPQKTSRY
jgi:hypothetical protein